tara:strand:- start:3133 stop:3324 length:192 start_codon:yes stop_codon:yes gene_type:complete
MGVERTLKKAIEYKFRTQAEFRNTTEEIFERDILGLGRLVGPIINPVDRMMDRIYNLYERFSR